MNRAMRVYRIFPWFFLLPLLSGCSLIGYSIGASIDRSHSSDTPLDATAELKEGEVLLLKWDSGIVQAGTVVETDAGRLEIEYYSDGSPVRSSLPTLLQNQSLVSITRYEQPSAGRSILTTLGIIADVGALYVMLALALFGINGIHLS